MRSPPINPKSARVVRDYLRAKDAQLPHLFAKVFSPDAIFVPTYDFPAPFADETCKKGLHEVSEVFHQMGNRCENIVTVVPVESILETGDTLKSDWVVALTQRNNEEGFVGWGTYGWTFDSTGERATQLAVCFQGMVPMRDEDSPPILDAFEDLSHPWCERAALAEATLSSALLAPLQSSLG